MALASKIAVVTGGAFGIGRGIAQRFAAEGATVVVADVEPDRAGDAKLFLEADVSRAEEVERLFAVVVDTFGGVDVLVNNAAIAHGPAAERHFLDTSEEMWDRLMAVNLKSLYLCSRRAAEIMIERGGGSIINMSSGGATRAHRHRVAYDATKGAIEAATRAMALDLAPWAIRVNALAPGVIAVERRSPVGAEGSIGLQDVVPLGRMGTPDDIAAAATFLASDDASYVTGAVLPVDGGLLAQLRSPKVDIPPGEPR
ncbi:MAG: glucose 1-dehydrogenase [Actinomycetota bacterium]